MAGTVKKTAEPAKKVVAAPKKTAKKVETTTMKTGCHPCGTMAKAAKPAAKKPVAKKAAPKKK